MRQQHTFSSRAVCAMASGPVLSTVLLAAHPTFTSCAGEDSGMNGAPAVTAPGPSMSTTGASALPTPTEPTTTAPVPPVMQGAGAMPPAAVGAGAMPPGAGAMPSGAGATPGMAVVEVPTFDDVAWLLNQSCGNGICHVPPGLDNEGFEPDLITTDYTTLYQQLMTYTVEECGNVPLITPGDPTNSAILKVTQKQCGDLAMPDGCATEPSFCLFQEDIDILTAWVNAGAPSE